MTILKVTVNDKRMGFVLVTELIALSTQQFLLPPYIVMSLARTRRKSKFSSQTFLVFRCVKETQQHQRKKNFNGVSL